MKRKMCSLILAIVTFIAAYMIMSFAIPGFRIKLEAEPAVVFVETLKILWPFKAAVSLIAAVLIGGLPLVLGMARPVDTVDRQRDEQDRTHGDNTIK